MLTVFHLPSLSETYKTMWFRLCFLSQAGGEFPSGFCVAWTLCCLIWLVIKISGKLHGKFVLTDSSHGLGSPGGSSTDEEVGASSQVRTIKAYGGWHWYLLVLHRQYMESRALQVLISNNWFQNLSRNYVKGPQWGQAGLSRWYLKDSPFGLPCWRHQKTLLSRKGSNAITDVL